MAKLLAANNAGTTISGNLAPGSTTITLASGSGAQFPHPSGGDWFMATLIPASSTTGLPNEIVQVINLSGDTATVVRAQEGTTALTFSPGDFFQNLWTAGSFRSLSQVGDLQAQAGNWALDIGNANNVVVNLTPAPASYAAITGAPIRVRKMNADNTGAMTINVNSLGAVQLLSNHGGGNLFPSALMASQTFETVFDGNVFVVLSDRLPGPSSVSNGQLATMPPNTVKSNLTGSTANPGDYSIAQLASAVAPQIPAGSLSNSQLQQMPNGTVKANITGGSNYPQDTAVVSVLGYVGLGGDLTGNLPSPTIGAQKVTNAKMYPMGPNTVKMNNTGSSAVPQDVPVSSLFTALGISYNENSTGYLKVGHIIINWGISTASITGLNQYFTVNHSLTFPSGCWGGIATVRNPNSDHSIANSMTWVFSSVSQSGFISNGYQSGGITPVPGFFWVVIGN